MAGRWTMSMVKPKRVKFLLQMSVVFILVFVHTVSYRYKLHLLLCTSSSHFLKFKEENLRLVEFHCDTWPLSTAPLQLTQNRETQRPVITPKHQNRMPSSNEAQQIEESLELLEIDSDLFKSIKLWKFASRSGAFGGNIIAQAAHAATKTVQTGFHLHSLHCYFISFGDVSIPTGIIYVVDRLRDGKSYVTRSVKALQRSRCIFSLLISFHRPELNQRTLRVKMDLSGILAPEKCQSTETRLQNYIDENKKSLSIKMLDYLERSIEETRLNAIEHRNTSLESLANPNYEATRVYWFRSRAKIRSDPAFQKLVLAYASDFRFIGTVGHAMGLNIPGGPQTSMLASLDHSMFFYDNDFDVSEWMLYRMDAEAGKDGRGLVIGRIYARDGRLLAICTQEGVVRVDANKSKSKL